MIQQLLLKFRAALVITVAIALAANALAQANVVTGTGNPGVDVLEFRPPSISAEKSF
jgi:hypothetical protein